MRALIFSTICLCNISLAKEKLSQILLKMCICLHVVYQLFLSDLNANLIFSIIITKNTQVTNFMKICPVGTELFHAHRETDRRDEANGRFQQFLRKHLKSTLSLHFYTGKVKVEVNQSR